MLKRIFFAALVLILQQYANGQSSFALKKADIYYKDSSYYNAILNYEIYLGIRTAPALYAPYSNNKKKKLLSVDEVTDNKRNSDGAFYNLAQSYRYLNDYVTAEKWYEKLLETRSSKFPLTRLWHGICLRAMGDYKSAEKDLRRFVKDNAKGDQDYTTLANNELNTISFIRQQVETKRPPAFAIHKLKGDVNKIEGAYSPIVLNDTTLLFTSARIIDTVGQFSKVNSHVNHLFTNTISLIDSVVGNSTKLKFPSSISSNEGTPTISSDGNSIYFTRWEGTEGKISSSIYVSRMKADSSWGDPVKLDEKINKVGYNSNQPFLTDDGKYLLFASDRPEGLGKYDIWASALDTSGFAEPFNLTTINSKDDDKAPFYHTSSKTLVFSSNGRIGMGGFDLYMATGDLTSLSTPVNMGAPINSVKDDNYFFSASKDSLMKRAFVSSDRASECCLEVFTIERLPKKIFKQKIDGLLSDCKTGSPIPYASITINNSVDTSKNIKLGTNVKGLFLVNLTDSTAGLTFKRKGYNDRTQAFRFNNDIYVDTTFLIEVCLAKSKKLNHKLHLDATVVDCETKKPLSKAFVTVLNAVDTSKNVVLATSTLGTFKYDLNDSIDGFWFEKKGYYDKDVHFKLESDSIDNDTIFKSTYCMEVFKAENTSNPSQIVSEKIVTKVVENINRSDSVTVHFDFNKTELKREAIEQLDNILAILKTYPTIFLELNISGHTDAKGSEEVNLKVGRQRAMACLDYMIQKGISESRLKLVSRSYHDQVAPDFINNKDNPDGRAKNRRVVIKAKASLLAPSKTNSSNK